MAAIKAINIDSMGWRVIIYTSGVLYLKTGIQQQRAVTSEHCVITYIHIYICIKLYIYIINYMLSQDNG